MLSASEIAWFHVSGFLAIDPRVDGLELVETAVVVNPVAAPLLARGRTAHRNRAVLYDGPNSINPSRRAIILGARLDDCPRPTVRHLPWNEIKQTSRQRRADSGGRGQ